MKIWIVGKMIYYIAGLSLTSILSLAARKRVWRVFVGYAKRIRETSFTSHFEIGLHIYGVVNHTIYMQEYRSGHNEAVLKNSRFCHCKIVKTLDFIEVFGCSSALCEKPFSQFSRNLLASFSQFLAIFLQYPKRFEPIFKGTKDYSGQFNNLRRHIEAVITRLSWKQFGSESPRGFKSLCLRQSLGALCSKAFFLFCVSPCCRLSNYNIPQKAS